MALAVVRSVALGMGAALGRAVVMRTLMATHATLVSAGTHPMVFAPTGAIAMSQLKDGALFGS